MSNQPHIMVAKREGGLEQFDRQKARRGVAAALASSGGDMRFADALARAVELHLRQWNEPDPPSSGYIFRCLRTALIETGLDDGALRFVSYRGQRAKQRQELSVYDADESRFALAPWRKAAVAETLEGCRGVGHAAARILAGEIERRVLSLGYSVVSKTLIREMIQSELLAWGMADAVPDAIPAVYGLNQAADHATN